MEHVFCLRGKVNWGSTSVLLDDMELTWFYGILAVWFQWYDLEYALFPCPPMVHQHSQVNHSLRYPYSMTPNTTNIVDYGMLDYDIRSPRWAGRLVCYGVPWIACGSGRGSWCTMVCGWMCGGMGKLLTYANLLHITTPHVAYKSFLLFLHPLPQILPLDTRKKVFQAHHGLRLCPPTSMVVRPTFARLPGSPWFTTPTPGGYYLSQSGIGRVTTYLGARPTCPRAGPKPLYNHKY